MNHLELYHRGNALFTAWRLEEALASYDAALALNPENFQAWNDRGNVLRELGRFDDAVASFTQAVALKPDYAQAFANRAVVMGVRQRNIVPAIFDLERAVALDPSLPYALGLLLHMKMLICDWRDFDRLAARVDAALRAGQAVIEPFAYQALSQSPADLMRCAAIFSRYPIAPLPPPQAGQRDRIRLGYLSGEFHEQATSHLMAGIYEVHDRDRFELIALDNGPDDGSPMRRRLEAAFDRLIDIKPLSDLDAAQRIRDEGVDILINLSGYFGRPRMGVCARRPAPVQVNYLGFPGTLGSGCIDYIVADPIVLPVSETPFYSEQVVWLPDCYQANDAKRTIAAESFSRQDCGLPETGFVFCNFNNLYKLTPAMFAVWMGLLREVEGSVLWLLECHMTATANLRSAARAQGVAPERLVFAPYLPLDRHLARLAQADLVLDSLPYNAHTTGSDALWAGVPLLTCRGTAFAGRVAASLLQAVGLPELVTETMADYKALALALARDPARLRLLREKLARNRRVMPLFDTARTTRHLESAYATMWEIFQRGEAPRSFAVPPVS